MEGLTSMMEDMVLYPRSYVEILLAMAKVSEEGGNQLVLSLPSPDVVRELLFNMPDLHLYSDDNILIIDWS